MFYVLEEYFVYSSINRISFSAQHRVAMMLNRNTIQQSRVQYHNNLLISRIKCIYLIFTVCLSFN